MKNPIPFYIHFFFISLLSFNTAAQCDLLSESIICKLDKMSITYSSEETYNSVTVSAFNQIDNMNIPALIQNKTSTSSDVIFLEQGNAEIVIQYFQNGVLVDICNQNVIVFDGDPIPSLGMISDFLGDQASCESIDVEFNVLLNCLDCIQTWTLDGVPIDLPQESFQINNLQSLTTSLFIDSLGEYTLCQNVLKADSTCFVEDCVNISITEITDAPSFTIVDQEELTYCMGSEIEFLNETVSEQNLAYIWTIEYDTLQWTYFSEDLNFEFNLPGEYEVYLQYYLTNDPSCSSSIKSETITITEQPILKISCNGQLCRDNEITYRSPINCSDYTWIVDENLGTIINQQDSIITVSWGQVNQYTETEVLLVLEDCDQNSCNELSTEVSLFPNNIEIEGPSNLCINGDIEYIADLIPEADYTWSINIIETISGVEPNIHSISGNIATVRVSSFVGQFELMVLASIDELDCEVSASKNIQRFNIQNSDNLCKEDLFKSELLPKIDEDVLWTIRREDGTIFKQELKSGLSSFLAFGFPTGGTYSISAAIPSLDFDCGSSIPFEIIGSPEVNLLGPLNICPGEEYSYSLQDLGANDIVEWTIFQKGAPTEIIGQEIQVRWEEGGAPYLIRVTRSTEISPGIVCESNDLLVDISEISATDIIMSGPQVVCYDAISMYSISEAGSYMWSIDPPNIGTIVDGDSTDNVTIQWHYAPDLQNALVTATAEVCNEMITSELDITFGPFIPTIDIPDSVCQREIVSLKITNLEDFTRLEYYINGELASTNNSNFSYLFSELGWNEINVIIINPNGCPQVVEETFMIFIKPTPVFNIDLSLPINQCPIDSFKAVTATLSVQDSATYYSWALDGVIYKEGFGSEDLYTGEITLDIIQNHNELTVIVTDKNGCTSEKGIALSISCPGECFCAEDIIASIDTIIAHECSLVSFSGSIDFNTILNAEWQIPQGDTTTIIQILSDEDLVQDSILLTEGSTQANITMSVNCLPIMEDGVTLSICPTETILENIPLYSPSVTEEYICTEYLNYDVTLVEPGSIGLDISSLYTIDWMINGQSFSGASVSLEEMEGGSILNIQITQCSLDGLYCCTNEYTVTVPSKFEPKIILPNGSCENELWLFSIDEPQNNIESILWDFGDGSGSTLYTTEKGFEGTDAQTISVVTTSMLGCTATATLEVESFPNTIDGIIEYSDAPCEPTTELTYTSLSKSEITSYEWNIPNSDNNPSATIVKSGNYVLTVTDIHGCTQEFSIENAQVNESFSGGIFVDDVNCGATNAYITTNSEYTYTWYINGDSTATGGNVSISEIGLFDIIIVSTNENSGMICDTLSKSIEIFSNPEIPNITSRKLYCDPLIAELTVTNYEEVTWNGMGIDQNSITFLTSNPGIYSATYTDENGCSSSGFITIIDSKVDFEYLEDICIQACREDLDSIGFIIAGNNQSFEEWSWFSVDSIGQEYTVISSSGNIPDLLVTDDMYDYLELQVIRDDCIFNSDRVPLDIIQCTIIEDEDIFCDTLDIFSNQCGITVYDCVLSEANGGPKLYYEGFIATSEPAFLCQDSLIATLNNGGIEILTFEANTQEDGTIHIDYSANIFIEDISVYEANETYINFEFCDAESVKSYCVDFKLPYRTCNMDFDCLIDCVGIFYGSGDYVFVNYCLNLSEVVQDDCILESYYLTLAVTNDDYSKMIYELTIEEDNYDQLYCLDIPISQEDFTSGEFNCLEMYVRGDCPDILCYDYQCGAFSPGLNENDSQSALTRQSFKIVSDLTSSDINIYPNPNIGIMTISVTNYQPNDKILIQNPLGQTIFTKELKDKTILVDLTNQAQGVYFASILRNREIMSTKKVLLIN